MSTTYSPKSHSDETLLTAGFNLRTQTDIHLKVPQGRHLVIYKSVIAARLMCLGGSSYPQVKTGG